MSIKPFRLGNIDMFEDPDAANEKLELWLDATMPEYLDSPEYKNLSKVNQKAGGEWFAMFMNLYLNYIGQNLKDLDENAAREIMLDLIPRKVICSDSQARKIVPDILACWQFLCREHELSASGLANLFMHIRQGDREAKNFWQEIEQNIQGAYEHNELKPEAMSVLVLELSHHKQFLSPAFLEFIHHWHLDITPKMSPEEANPEALQGLFMEMIDEMSDEFVLLSILKEQMGFLPPEGLQLLGGLLMVADSKAADGLALMVLDDNQDNARVMAETLAIQPEVVTPKTLSRLIRIRNWLAPDVQKPVDKLIRDVRKKGIAPQAPEPIAQKNILEIQMSGVDGSGAQGVMMMVRDGREFRLISFALKEAVGIVDVLVSPATTRGEVKQYLSMAKSELGNLEKVSLAMVRQQLPFFIALNLKSKNVIDHELVQAMEIFGLEDWNPETADLSTLYNALLQETPAQADIDAVQKRSQNWINATIGDSWFEMPDKLAPLRPLSSKNYHRVFEEIFEPARNQWGERMGRMALWCQGANNKRRQKQRRDFAMVSWLLNHSDLPVKDIDLIQSIAKNSI